MESLIRRARQEDVPGVSAVIIEALHQSNAEDYSPEIIERVALSFSSVAVSQWFDRRIVLVAESQGCIVGTVSLDGRAVRSLFVAPARQGQGLGRHLMAEVERVARDSGVQVLAVPSSVTAEGFYARLGYRAVRDSYHGEERTIVMERRLVDAGMGPES